MGREEKIFTAYENVGKLSSLYDGMMTASTLVGKFALKFFWGLSVDEYFTFLDKALAGVPKDFSGRLLEIPVGTGVFTLPRYKNLTQAEIICADYSPAMLNAAKDNAKKLSLSNVTFVQGDVGKLSFCDNFFEVVLSVNGLHAFPDKDAAQNEICRVLKPNGIFCGSSYVTGQNWRTDFFVKHFCNRVGVFTPPHENLSSLNARLKNFYRRVEISNVNSFACFVCSK
ncbi:MAG: class I SAM-dependent methyltransferase [Selenomonadaceae bacterium]|nr:class I SAM-dependent methyltransferase [Selenomonadaceae bacterium]